MNAIGLKPYNRILHAVLVLVVLLGVLGAAVQPAAAASGASLSIISVNQGETVTIRAEGFPGNKEFQVLINKIGTRGEDGVEVALAKTDRDGSFTKTVSIPRELRRDSRLAIRIEATDDTGWYAYNWFENKTSGANSGDSDSDTDGGSSAPSGGTTTGGAWISVEAVVEDRNVTIEAGRLPARTGFNVWLEWKSRRGSFTSVKVDTLYSDRNGALNEVVSIPRVFRDRPQLRIRLIAIDGSNIAVGTWFLNVNSDDGIGAGSPSGFENGIPYLEILSVKKEVSVTISARNLPARKEFVVLMGRMGTDGVNGIEVGSIKTDKKGELTGTFEIPNRLAGRDEIAIRLEAEDGSGYYAFNWFENENK